MLPAVAAVVSASETAAVTWALKARAVARNVSAACCVFFPLSMLLFFVFVVSAFLPFLQLFSCGGGKGDVACFTVSVASPYIRLAVAFAAAHSDWRAKQAHWHTSTHTHARIRRQAQKFQQLNHSFILFYISFIFALCTYISFRGTVCILMKLNKNT